MRLACLPAAIIAALTFLNAAAAFEIEERATYTAPNPQTELRIISTADRDVFEPILLAFQEENQTVSIDYTIASTTELMKAVHEEGVLVHLPAPTDVGTPERLEDLNRP